MAMQRDSMSRVRQGPARGGWQYLGPASRGEWEEVLATDPAALPTQTPAWLAGTCATGPYTDASRLYRRPDGGRLVLPLVRRKGRPGPLGMQRSLPAAYGGLVSEGGLLTHHDVSAVLADLGRHLRGSIAMTPSSHMGEHYDKAEGWSSISRKWAQVVDLSGGFEEVWSRCFSSSVRRAVRKAERSEISVVSDTTGGLLPQFLELYEKSVVRWAKQSGIPPTVALLRASRRESLDRLRGLAAPMSESCVTWMAFVDGAPAAGIIVLTQGAHSHYWHGAMDLDLAGRVRANDLLHKRAIEEACDRARTTTGSAGVTRHGSLEVQGGLRSLTRAVRHVHPGAAAVDPDGRCNALHRQTRSRREEPTPATAGQQSAGLTSQRA